MTASDCIKIAMGYLELASHLSKSKYVPVPIPSSKDIDRFWDKVVVPADPNECQIWKAATCGSATVYGQFTCRSRPIKAHVFSFWIDTGVLPPPGVHVCHSCDDKLCVNPRHLFLGTQSDNMRDFKQKLNHERDQERNKNDE